MKASARVGSALLAVAWVCTPRPATARDAATPPPAAPAADLDKLAGQPADLSPWAYAWRADRQVQEPPEAYFIPRRLERIDKVYRTALPTLKGGVKSIYYDQKDLLAPLPPPPKGRLLAGLLWVGGLSKYQVELRWPADMKDPPSPAAIEVRAYPTAWGWFGWTVDQVMGPPEISGDGRTWTYKPKPGATMDWAYSKRVDAATEMVAVFAEGKTPVPTLRVIGPQLGLWTRMDVEIEWTFDEARIEGHVAVAGKGVPLAAPRKGIRLPVLYAPDARPGLDSRLTLWSGATGVTIRLRDLEKGPVYVPRPGVYASKAGSGPSMRQFAAELAARKLKSVRQRVREHPEAESWEQAFREVRLWRCPPNTPVPPFAQAREPAMQVQVPDERWAAMWRTATDQLRGRHMWGNLAAEVAPVAHAMEMMGLHAEAAKIYDYFLRSPGVKADGDFSDGKGSLEWAKAMRHDMAYNHEACHFSTGRLLYAMAERYFLAGDKEWFARHKDRLIAAADWIVRERNGYMRHVPNRKDLHVAGLLPPGMMGDYAMPASDWHWFYFDNVFALQGLARFADALGEMDPPLGRTYRQEAEAFRADIRRAAERDAALSPVRPGRDGAYHSFIPIRAYARGLMYTELGAPQYGGGRSPDLMIGALPLALFPAPVLPADDPRMMETIDAMEEGGTAIEEAAKLAEGRVTKGLTADEAWFWTAYIDLPKWAFNAPVYLLQDDVPSFLRFWINESVSMVGSDGKLWEHWRPDSYAPCKDPDNGTSGWFLSNFRNLLVMEEGPTLWLARGTPRAWLASGKKISVKNAPTHFGTVAYEIVSDVDDGKIGATIEMPSRKAPAGVILRLRHPKAAPIKAVTVNGQPSTAFNKEKETIALKGLNGKVTVQASY